MRPSLNYKETRRAYRATNQKEMEGMVGEEEEEENDDDDEDDDGNDHDDDKDGKTVRRGNSLYPS